jgi:hypothetical protein
VTLVPLPVTVMPVPPVNVTVDVPEPPATDTPAATVCPVVQAIDGDDGVTTSVGGVIDTSSPQAARPKPAAATASVRQLTSLIR